MINIAILGSTGSIGITTLNIIRKDKKKFKIKLLSSYSNISLLFEQAKEFNVKHVIIGNVKSNRKFIKKFREKNIEIYTNFNSYNKIFKKKLDYSISAISGIDGLEPTLKIIKHTKKIAIANKESIICGWSLIKKELFKNRTKFVPVDSEHFSIYKLIQHKNKNEIKKVIITASGGPFLKKKIHNKIKISDALKHPNWKMGKKITIDSSTLMNKVFEVLEAKKIFNLDLNKIDILINPNSYLHAIVIFKNGTIKMLAHEADMGIPIFNSIYENYNPKSYETKNLDLNKINKLNLSKPNAKKFKALKVLKVIPKNDSLFETVLISANDELVNMFLNNEIIYKNILFYFNKIINFKIFKKYCKVKPVSINQIYNLRDLVKKTVREYVNKNY